jgi:LemA protein
MFNLVTVGVGIIAIAIIIGFVAVGAYNALVAQKNRVQEALSDIDVQLKRRYDLIGNLVETVKGSTKFEQETLQAVIKARNTAMSIDTVDDSRMAAENVLSGSLKNLFALSENYPDLKSSQNFLQLQQELVNTEDRVLSARRFYNQTVNQYNTSQDTFPTMLFNNMAGTKKEKLFELENPTVERQNPKIQF